MTSKLHELPVNDRSTLYSASPSRFRCGAGNTVLRDDVVPIDVYWVSYYAVDYTFGFVRRGLAGEIVGLAPGGHYFDAAAQMRWLSTGVYVIGLVAIIGFLVLRGQRSERKLMVALLIFVLPFAIPFSRYSARPDLFGAAALVAFSVALTVVRSPRPAIWLCGGYGAVIAVLTLVHEAIGLEFALGAVLAIVVLGRRLRPSVQRRGVLLAVGPGWPRLAGRGVRPPRRRRAIVFDGPASRRWRTRWRRSSLSRHSSQYVVRGAAHPNRLSRLGVPQRITDLRLQRHRCHQGRGEHRGGPPAASLVSVWWPSPRRCMRIRGLSGVPLARFVDQVRGSCRGCACRAAL